MDDKLVFLELLINDLLNNDENIDIRPVKYLENDEYIERAVSVYFSGENNKYKLLIIMDEFDTADKLDKKVRKIIEENNDASFVDFNIEKVISENETDNLFFATYVDKNVKIFALEIIKKFKEIAFKKSNSFNNYLDDSNVEILNERFK